MVWVSEEHKDHFSSIPIVPKEVEIKLQNLSKSNTLKFDINDFKINYYDEPICKLISLVFDKDNNIIAYRYANIHMIELGKYKASKYSYIAIDSKFQGKGLCTPFVSYAYDELIKYVDYIELIINSKKTTIACRCYIKSALSLGNVKIYVIRKSSEFEVKTINDCNKKINNMAFIKIVKNI